MGINEIKYLTSKKAWNIELRENQFIINIFWKYTLEIYMSVFFIETEEPSTKKLLN